MIECVDGVWWERGCKHNTPAGRLARRITAAAAAAHIASLCAQRRMVVQAGGWIGFWPQALAQHFARVVTCEPAADNWEALQRNVTADNVTATRAAFGAHAGSCSLTRDTPASGMWRVMPGEDVPVVTIDGWGVPSVDAIVLDVEGSELAALMGAEATITRDHPAIWLECLHHKPALTAWLAARGYEGPVQALKQDGYFLWSPG